MFCAERSIKEADGGRHQDQGTDHPGTLLREIVSPAMRVSIAQEAREMGISRQQLYKILAENGRVTAEMAARLGKHCGNGQQVWLNMQSAFDLWHA